MMRFDVSEIFSGLCMTMVLALAFTSGPALADGPAAIAPADEPANASFAKFARSWMDKVQRIAAEEQPTIRPGATNTMATYRNFTDDFAVELRPTGNAAAPYVGILRYNEQVFSCRNLATNDCTLASQTPITEIFRYQNGRWVY